MAFLKPILLFLTAGVFTLAASDADRLSDQAQQALNAHHWADASSALEQLAKLAPDVPEVYANLGLAYYFQGRATQALASFQRALHLNPEMPQATIMSGICQAELGHHREAIAILDPAFRSPTDPQIGRLIGLHLEDSFAAVKQFDKASVIGEELLRRYPGDPEILFQVSRLHADRSYQLMTDLVRSAPNSPWMHYANAQVQESLQHYDAAIQEYENVVKAEPGLASVHYRLGLVTLLASTDPESIQKAKHAFEQELALSPRNADALYELGEIDREQGRYETARDYFTRAIAEHPEFVEARIALGRTLLKLGKASDALPHLQEAARLDPSNKVPHFLLAKAYEAVGDSAGSRNELDSYRKLQQEGALARVRTAGAPTAQQIDH
ncbi:MAG TPA: tetratricopeptide repeat protein [Bryobacteraceae bacterium]|nr:tetratricopeptide repeat protein [Bryobacteraceae bacterium]